MSKHACCGKNLPDRGPHSCCGCRTKFVQIFLSARDAELLKRKAKRVGKAQTEFLREVIAKAVRR